jgi:HK97 family phage portal protein
MRLTGPKRLPRTSTLRSPVAAGPESRASLNGSTSLASAIAASNLTGVSVTERNALTLPAAFACINVLATDLSFFPLRVVQRTDAGRRERTDHPADALLRFSPDGETTTMRARQAWLGHTFGWGNGYQAVERDTFGRPAAIHRLDPADTEPLRRLSDDRLYYKSGAKTYRPDQVLHLAGLGFDGLRGYSPVKLARQAIALGLATESCGAALFGNGLINRGMIRHPGTMTEEAWERFRRQIESTHLGVENSHKFLLLEEGTEWVQTSMSPEDSQFLESRKFQVIDICRMWRVPPHKVMDYSQAGSAYRALEEANLDYVNTTLGPWCEQIEQELGLKLLTEDERLAGFSVEHSLAALLRGDSAARIAYLKGLRDLGVLTPNLAAALEGLDPVGPGGDVRVLPSGFVPLLDAEDDAEEDDPEEDNADVAVVADAGAADVQSLALNGAQVTAMLEVVAGVAAGTIPPSSAKAILAAAFPTLSASAIAEIVDPIEVTPPAPAPAPEPPTPNPGGPVDDA